MKRHKEGGATLIIALMFLIVLTLLGIAGSRNAVLQERMAGASRDRSVAFQAAELALRSGEKLVVKQNPLSFDSNCTGGYCAMGKSKDWSDADLWKAGTYANTVSISGTALENLVHDSPKFQSEYMGIMPCKGCDQGMSDVFRVYGHGTGAREDSISNLASTIRP